MAEFEATSPVEPDVAPAEQVEATEPEVIEPQLDENGEPVQTPPPKRSIKFIDHDMDLPDWVTPEQEVEISEIGKELERGVQRKFQTAAQELRAAQEMRQQWQAEQQAQREAFQEVAELVSLDKQLAAYKDANGNEFTPMQWMQWQQQDPQAASAAFMQYQALQNQRNAIAGKLESKKTEFTQKQQAELARLHSEGQRVLQEKIPEWGAAKQQALAKHAQEAYGFQPQELSNVLDPRVVLLMHDAMQYRQSLEKAKAKPAAPTPQPVQKVGSVAPVSKTPDKMSDKEWIEWREKQVARKNRR
jgi:hypothetical protein